MRGQEKRGFFAEFYPGKLAIKANGFFIAVLASLSVIADWSYWADSVRGAVRERPFAVIGLLLAWNVLSFLYELLRLKLRHDLAEVRDENRRRKQGRRKP